MAANFDKLNRETWIANNIGNEHHLSSTGIKHPVDFSDKNRDTFANNNGISKSEIYASYGRPW